LLTIFKLEFQPIFFRNKLGGKKKKKKKKKKTSWGTEKKQKKVKEKWGGY
jgi:hypothetical protein